MRRNLDSVRWGLPRGRHGRLQRALLMTWHGLLVWRELVAWHGLVASPLLRRPPAWPWLLAGKVGPRRLCWMLPLGLLWLWPSMSRAEIPMYAHRVEPGDTLASIAEACYGDVAKERILVDENGLTAHGGAVISPGMRLVIPTIGHHRVSAGDTWRSIAARYYGLGSRAFVITEVNKVKAGAQPDPGAVLVLPYPLRYVATKRESLAAIAERMLGNSELAGRIQRFNQLKRPRVQRGNLLLIPSTDLIITEEARKRLQHEGADTAKEIEAQETHRFQVSSKEELTKIQASNAQGHYVSSVVQGERWKGKGALSQSQAVTLSLLLAEAYVALNEDALADEAIADALKRSPTLQLDEERHSPKLRDRLEKLRQSAPSGRKSAATRMPADKKKR